MKTSGEMLRGKHYLARLTAPIFIESLLMLLISNVDQVMLSRFSQDAVTAVGNANQFSFFMLMFFNVYEPSWMKVAAFLQVVSYQMALFSWSLRHTATYVMDKSVKSW